MVPETWIDSPADGACALSPADMHATGRTRQSWMHSDSMPVGMDGLSSFGNKPQHSMDKRNSFGSASNDRGSFSRKCSGASGFSDSDGDAAEEPVTRRRISPLIDPGGIPTNISCVSGVSGPSNGDGVEKNVARRRMSNFDANRKAALWETLRSARLTIDIGATAPRPTKNLDDSMAVVRISTTPGKVQSTTSRSTIPRRASLRESMFGEFSAESRQISEATSGQGTPGSTSGKRTLRSSTFTPLDQEQSKKMQMWMDVANDADSVSSSSDDSEEEAADGSKEIPLTSHNKASYKDTMVPTETVHKPNDTREKITLQSKTFSVTDVVEEFKKNEVATEHEAKMFALRNARRIHKLIQETTNVPDKSFERFMKKKANYRTALLEPKNKAPEGPVKRAEADARKIAAKLRKERKQNLFDRLREEEQLDKACLMTQAQPKRPGAKENTIRQTLHPIDRDKLSSFEDSHLGFEDSQRSVNSVASSPLSLQAPSTEDKRNLQSTTGTSTTTATPYLNFDELGSHRSSPRVSWNGDSLISQQGQPDDDSSKRSLDPYDSRSLDLPPECSECHSEQPPALSSASSRVSSQKSREDGDDQLGDGASSSEDEQPGSRSSPKSWQVMRACNTASEKLVSRSAAREAARKKKEAARSPHKKISGSSGNFSSTGSETGKLYRLEQRHTLQVGSGPDDGQFEDIRNRYATGRRNNRMSLAGEALSASGGPHEKSSTAKSSKSAKSMRFAQENGSAGGTPSGTEDGSDESDDNGNDMLDMLKADIAPSKKHAKHHTGGDDLDLATTSLDSFAGHSRSTELGKRRRNLKLPEVPRLRYRMRDQSEILGGRFSDCVDTTKRYNLHIAEELGLETSDWNPENRIDKVYTMTKTDLEKAALAKLHRLRNIAAIRVQRRWRSIVIYRLTSALLRNRRQAYVRIQRWWSRKVRFQIPIKELCDHRPKLIQCAIKVQAMLRSFWAKRKIKHQAELHSVTFRMRRLHSYLVGGRQVAATRIQAAMRMHLARTWYVNYRREEARRLLEEEKARLEAEDRAQQLAEDIRRNSLMDGRRYGIRVPSKEGRNTSKNLKLEDAAPSNIRAELASELRSLRQLKDDFTRERHQCLSNRTVSLKSKNTLHPVVPKGSYLKRHRRLCYKPLAVFPLGKLIRDRKLPLQGNLARMAGLQHAVEPHSAFVNSTCESY